MPTRVLYVTLLGLLLGVVSGCGGQLDILFEAPASSSSASFSVSSAASSARALTTSEANGKALMQSNQCARCHIDNGDGTYTAAQTGVSFDVRAFNYPKRLTQYSDATPADLARFIDDFMPAGVAFVTDAQSAKDIAAYLWIARTDGSKPNPIRPFYGNAEKGKILLQSAPCANCHTDNHDGTFSKTDAYNSASFNVRSFKYPGLRPGYTADSPTALAAYIDDFMPAGSAFATDATQAADAAAYLWQLRGPSSSVAAISSSAAAVSSSRPAVSSSSQAVTSSSAQGSSLNSNNPNSSSRSAIINLADGKRTYDANCEVCHGTAGDGTYPIDPTKSTYQYRQNPALPLADYISRYMPQGRVGSCVGSCAASVAAYIQNQFKAPEAISPFACSSPDTPSPAPLRRLSKEELINTFSDILGEAAPASLNNLPPDERISGKKGFINSVNDLYTQQLITSAREAALRVIQPTALRNRFWGSCFLNADNNFKAANALGNDSSSGKPCVQHFLTQLGLRVYRRPLNATDLTHLQALFNTQTDPVPQRLETLVTRLFLAPEFLFLLENEGTLDTPNNRLALTDYAVAARLSYGLIGSTPDEPLLAAAANGQLRTPADIRSQIDRLVLLPGAKTKLDGFFTFWLDTGQGPHLNVSPEFAGARSALAIDIQPGAANVDLLQELHLFNRYLLWGDSQGQNKGRFFDLYTSRASFPTTANTAHIFNTPLWQPGTPPVQAGADYAGLLTKPALLAGGDETTHPILRGVKVLRQMLCETLPMPDASIVAARSNQVALSPLEFAARERVTELTKAEACAGCHTRINPIGFVLESFDSLGRVRSLEGIFDTYTNGHPYLGVSHPINTATQIPLDGQTHTLANAAALGQTLGQSNTAKACFAKQVFRFNHFRDETPADQCQLNGLFQTTHENTLLEVFIHPWTAPSVQWKQLEN